MAKTSERNLIDAPLYTPLDVAHYLRAPVWLVMCAWRGRIPPHPEMFFQWFEKGLRLVGMEDDLPDFPAFQDRWSFRQAADLYVCLFAVESLLGMAREAVRERHEVLRLAAWSVYCGHLRKPVFFHSKEGPPERAIARLLSECGTGLTDGERGRLEKKLSLCLGRFDMDETDPERLYPFTRVPIDDSPRFVVLDPAIRFGRPTITGHGTPVDMVLERHQAGDSIADLADDYGLSAEEVEEVLRYETKPLSPFFPFYCW